MIGTKTAQLFVWGFLGLGVLLSYVLLVFAFGSNTSKLWFGVPKWIQYMAYILWFLAACGAITYAFLADYRLWRFLFLSLLLVGSMLWSLSLVFGWSKSTTAAILIIVALCCIGTVLYDALVAKNLILVLCLVPLLLVNVGIDGIVWNRFFLLQNS